MLGQTVGKYRVISRLGRGGMGTVYKAIDETLGREVAIKRLNPDHTEHDVLKRFRAEAMTLARLNHPNIATLFELAEYDGEILMVMEFVRGETFEGLCERLGAMPIGRAIELCSQVFDALSHAHRAGIVHRDLKPANLMLAESGIVKVMDFGLARMSGSEHLTSDGYMVGTPAYMSPEQVLGGEVDGRADLYAMGVVLYRLLSGQLPFKARSGVEMAHRQMYDQPTPVRQLRTELPSACEAILLRALAKAPEDRFQTADEFRAALAPFSDTPVTESVRSSLTGFASAELAKTVSMPAPFPTGASPLDMPTMTAISPLGGQVPSAALAGSGESATVAAPAPAPPAATTPAPPASVTPAPAASVTPGPPAAGGRAKRLPIGAVIAAALVLVSVPVAMFVWRARSVSGDGSTAAVAPPPPPAAAAAAAPAVVSEPAPPPATEGPAASTLPTAKAPTPAPPSSKPTATPRSGGPGAKTATANAPAAAEPPVVEAPPAPPAPRAEVPVVTFAKVKILLFDGGKAKDRDASLRFEGDGLHVVDGNTPIKSAAYGDVIAVFHSHSREPRWATPDGTAVAVAKTGGKFSFFKGVPDWVTVRTKEGFIPLRIDDTDLRRVITELEARTGTKVVRTK